MGVHSVSATRRAETLGDFDNEHDEDSTEKSYKTKDRLWEDTRYTSNMNMPSREMAPKKKDNSCNTKIGDDFAIFCIWPFQQVPHRNLDSHVMLEWTETIA
jgi:hypothetical protein